MTRENQTQEDYIKSTNEFKRLIDMYFRLCKKSASHFGASDTIEFFKVGKSLERGADIFDEMMHSDMFMLKNESVYIHFWKKVEIDFPCYNCSQSERERQFQDPGKTLPVSLYRVIAKDLNAFSNDLGRFVIDLQKYHGKTKIRCLLDSDKSMSAFYFRLESRMYRENPGRTDLLDVF